MEWPLRVTVNETAWVRLVIRILFDDLSRGNAFEDLLNRNTIGGRLFVSMIRYSNPPGLYGIHNQLEFDQAVLPYGQYP